MPEPEQFLLGVPNTTSISTSRMGGAESSAGCADSIFCRNIFAFQNGLNHGRVHNDGGHLEKGSGSKKKAGVQFTFHDEQD